MAPPKELDGAKVLKYACISSSVEPTGATRHIVGGDEMGQAAALAIARYADEQGFYLLYLDEEGNVVTDTWHESVADAVHQAEFEYRGLSWSDVQET